VRNRAITCAITMAGALLLATGLVSTAPVATAATTAAQVVTVSAPSSSSTYATVEAWQRQPDGRYRRVAVFPQARIGSQGMGPTSESLSRTPTGQYTLSQPFGLKPNPGNTGVPYFQVDKNDVWTGSNGAVINEHRRCAPGTCPSSYGSGERLSNYPGAYDYAFFIGYNANPPYGTGAQPGRGSAFFFHVRNGQATAGCVAVAATQMNWLIRWLRFQNAPLVSIGVGSGAYAPIPNRYV
jgi:L,D-peptidoglycan transpeptidase YkuD (ErfK/YbiS/YcfS/YnhG family)